MKRIIPVALSMSLILPFSLAAETEKPKEQRKFGFLDICIAVGGGLLAGSLLNFIDNPQAFIKFFKAKKPGRKGPSEDIGGRRFGEGLDRDLFRTKRLLFYSDGASSPSISIASSSSSSSSSSQDEFPTSL